MSLLEWQTSLAPRRPPFEQVDASVAQLLSRTIPQRDRNHPLGPARRTDPQFEDLARLQPPDRAIEDPIADRLGKIGKIAGI